MSGLGTFSSGGNATYLRIGMGKDQKGRDAAVIGKRAKQGDPGAVPVLFKGEPVVNDKGEALFRTEHPNIEGLVTKIERAEPEYNGKKVDVLNITFSTTDGVFCLQLDKGKDYWIDFALRCKGIDWSKPLKLHPYSIPQEDSPKFSNRLLMALQGGEKLKRVWMIKWWKEQGQAPDPEPGHPPMYTYDHEEEEWKRKKVWNWLDQNVIQEAIDKVAFLNDGPQAHDDAPPYPSEEDMPPMNDEQDETPF